MFKKKRISDFIVLLIKVRFHYMEELVTCFSDRDYKIKRRGLKVHKKGKIFRNRGVEF